MERRPEQHEVFVSFAEADRRLADRICDGLRREGVRVRGSGHGAESAASQPNQLRALDDSKVAVFLVTEAAARTPGCLDEARRAADPGALSPVSIPLVVGAWPYEASDLWLLLSTREGILASPTLSDEALQGLTNLVLRAIGSRPTSSPSAGRMLSAVKDELMQYLKAGAELTGEEILAHVQQLQTRHQDGTVAFSQLTHLDREMQAAELLPASGRAAYLKGYLAAFFDTVIADGRINAATRLVGHIDPDDAIVIFEGSRLVRHAIQLLGDSDHHLFRSLRFLVVSRTAPAAASSRLEAELRALGAEPQVVPAGVWFEHLTHRPVDMDMGRVNKILVGVEAFNRSGEAVCPQAVRELHLLRAPSAGGSPLSDALIIAAGEAFRVCRDAREVSKMGTAPHRTLMPADAFDLIVTDIGEFSAASSAPIDLRSCIEYVNGEADKLREALWPPKSPLPVWNLRRRVRRCVTTVVSDVDGTLTDGQMLSLEALGRFQALSEAGIRVILVTGRSAGWGAALGHYLPGVFAVVAENGAVLIDRHAPDSAPILLDGWSETEHQDALENVTRCLQAVRERFPQIAASADNFTRLTDRTFLTDDDLDPTAIGAIVRSCGLRHTYSTVHHHISASRLDKESGLRVALRDHLRLDIVPEEHVIAVGDSFNDAPLFRKQRFASSVGVRSVLGHLNAFGPDTPEYVTIADGGAGFAELADMLMQAPPPAG